MKNGLPFNQVCFFLCLQECSRFGLQDATRLISNMCYEKEVFYHTLALGSRPRQGLASGVGQEEAWESHLMLLRV